MIKRRLATVHRRLRQRAQLTQQELSDRCGIARWKIGWIESDRLERLRFEEVDRSLEALGGELEIGVRYRGAEVERVIDELHAQLVKRVVLVLRALGWDVRVEVTFSEWGERGSYDILAWRADLRVLLVIEVKSEIATVEGTLRPLDVKVRLARKVVEKRFGWRARILGHVLVLPEDRTARRVVQRHADVMLAALPARSRAVRAWLRTPNGVMAGIWFVSSPNGGSWQRNPSSVCRVRPGRASC